MSKRDDKRVGEGRFHHWGCCSTKGNRVRNRCLFFLLPSLCPGFGVDCELIFRDWCLPLSRIIFEKSAFSVFRNFILYFYIFFFTILMIFRVEDSFFLRFTMSK